MVTMQKDTVPDQPARETKKKTKGCFARLLRLFGWLFLTYVILANLCMIVPFPFGFFIGKPLMALHHAVYEHLPVIVAGELRSRAKTFMRQKYGQEFEAGEVSRIMYDWPDIDLRFFYDVYGVKIWLKQSPDIKMGFLGSYSTGLFDDDDNGFQYFVWKHEVQARVARLIDDDLFGVDISRGWKKDDVLFAQDIEPKGRLLGFQEARELLGNDFSFTLDVERFYFCDSTDEEAYYELYSGDRLIQEATRLREALLPEIEVESLSAQIYDKAQKEKALKAILPYIREERGSRHPNNMAEKEGFFLGSNSCGISNDSFIQGGKYDKHRKYYDFR